MSDRYSDRRDSYNNRQYGRYSDDSYGYGYDDNRYDDGYDSRYADSNRRSQRSNRSRGYQADDYRSADSYRSTGASSAAGAYADNRGNGSTRRMPQDSPNSFSEHFDDDAINSYRRSAYGSGSSSAGAQRYSRSPQRSPMQTQASGRSGMRPATIQQGGRGAYGAGGSNGGAHGNYAPKRSNKKRNIIIAAVIVLAVVLIGAGAAWAYVNSISENLHRNVTQEALDALEPAPGESETTSTALADTPFYMLLMGADVGGWRAGDEKYAGDQYGRSDSMILARIDPPNKKVALISIHRDTMVDLGEYGQQKINAAYEFYGPAGAIKAVSTMAGVPISHYAVVDFGGFSSIVDALGGVEVNVPMDINDDVIDAHLSAGWQTLNGEQALDLCRSRHSYDDVADDGDVMRAANQRMVISAIAKKILSSDVMTIASSVQTLSQYVTTDLELSDIIGLAQIYKGMDPEKDMYTAMEPTTSAYIDETWYEYLDEAAWKEMIKRMDQGLPPVNKTEIDERTGTILSTGGADAPVV